MASGDGEGKSRRRCCDFAGCSGAGVILGLPVGVVERGGYSAVVWVGVRGDGGDATEESVGEVDIGSGSCGQGGDKVYEMNGLEPRWNAKRQ